MKDLDEVFVENLFSGVAVATSCHQPKSHLMLSCPDSKCLNHVENDIRQK